MISIIVPVYKVEKYLPACIESVITQTYTDWELLLIDDGSPDSCPEICDNYAQKDSRIRVFHKVNGGVSSARNLGLDEAKGEWIMFLDSDDMLVKDALEICIDKQQKCDSDIVCIQHLCIHEDGSIFSEQSLMAEESLDNVQFTKRIMLGKLPLVIWGKMYRRNIIGTKRFKQGVKIGEDALFLQYVFYDTKCKIQLLKHKLYLYRIVKTSVSRSSRKKMQLENAILTVEYDKLYAEIEATVPGIYDFEIGQAKYYGLLSFISRQGLIKHVTEEQRHILKEYYANEDNNRLLTNINKHVDKPLIVLSLILSIFYFPRKIKEIIKDNILNRS